MGENRSDPAFLDAGKLSLARIGRRCSERLPEGVQITAAQPWQGASPCPQATRKDIVRKGEVATYHVWSRCVQGAWLCGEDPQHGVDYSHRREWIERLLEYLTGVFAVDVGGYHLLSNHQHAILCTRPDIAAKWDDEEVAYRWKMAWPEWTGERWECQPTDSQVRKLQEKGDEHIAKLRCRLSSLSWFVGRWKQPIARACNLESNRRGHFFESRFGSRELVDHDEIFRALAYTELQQVKAGCAELAECSLQSSFERRLSLVACSRGFGRGRAVP